MRPVMRRAMRWKAMAGSGMCEGAWAVATAAPGRRVGKVLRNGTRRGAPRR